jgi:hypothetical protein
VSCLGTNAKRPWQPRAGHGAIVLNQEIVVLADEICTFIASASEDLKEDFGVVHAAVKRGTRDQQQAHTVYVRVMHRIAENEKDVLTYPPLAILLHRSRTN